MPLDPVYLPDMCDRFDFELPRTPQTPTNKSITWSTGTTVKNNFPGEALYLECLDWKYVP